MRGGRYLTRPGVWCSFVRLRVMRSTAPRLTWPSPTPHSQATGQVLIESNRRSIRNMSPARLTFYPLYTLITSSGTFFSLSGSINRAGFLLMWYGENLY